MIWHRIRQFLGYLGEKLPEVLDMGPKDALLAKLVMDIHRKRTHSTQEIVALAALEPVHALDRPEVLAKVAARQQAVEKSKADLLRQGDLTRDDLMGVLPSVSGFKVVATSQGRFIAFEGNGRLEALQRVFQPEDGLRLEVEVYHFEDARKILRRARRVQRRNRVGPFAEDVSPRDASVRDVSSPDASL